MFWFSELSVCKQLLMVARANGLTFIDNHLEAFKTLKRVWQHYLQKEYKYSSI